MQEQNGQLSNSLTIALETYPGQGQDANLWLTYGDSLLMAVFDGMGGRSGLIGEEQGARVASYSARESTLNFFKALEENRQKLDKTNLIGLQQQIQYGLQQIKNDANKKNAGRRSRVKGFKDTFQKDKLATTLALVSISQSQDSQDIIDLDLAWMGDSRIYFLSPRKGLQQLTKDDLEEYKDAFNSVFEAGSPISQYLSPNVSANGAINFKRVQIEENGLIIACTDGAFDGLYPWEFEHVLLYLLNNSKNIKEWRDRLIEYNQTREVGDDVTLLLFNIGFGDHFNNLKTSYNNRYQRVSELCGGSNNSKKPEELNQIWNIYRKDYEEKIDIDEAQGRPLANTLESVINPTVAQKFSNFGSGSAKIIEGSNEKNKRLEGSIDIDASSKTDTLQEALLQSLSSTSAREESCNLHYPDHQDTILGNFVFLSEIQRQLDQEDYDQALLSLEQVMQETESQFIPNLSYYIVALIKRRKKGVQIPTWVENKRFEKEREIFKKIYTSIQEKKFVEDNSDYAYHTLKRLAESFCQLEIEDFSIIISNQAEIELIKKICSKQNELSCEYEVPKGGEEGNAYAQELMGKILAFEQKEQKKNPSSKKSEDVKKCFEKAQNLYKKLGNKKRSNECKKQLNKLRRIWKRNIPFLWLIK